MASAGNIKWQKLEQTLFEKPGRWHKGNPELIPTSADACREVADGQRWI